MKREHNGTWRATALCYWQLLTAYYCWYYASQHEIYCYFLTVVPLEFQICSGLLGLQSVYGCGYDFYNIFNFMDYSCSSYIQLMCRAETWMVRPDISVVFLGLVRNRLLHHYIKTYCKIEYVRKGVLFL